MLVMVWIDPGGHGVYALFDPRAQLTTLSSTRVLRRNVSVWPLFVDEARLRVVECHPSILRLRIEGLWVRLGQDSRHVQFIVRVQNGASAACVLRRAFVEPFVV